jgi:hypothetical protein
VVVSFDNLDQNLLMRAVKKHASQRWMVLYIERWLKAPVERARSASNSSNFWQTPTALPGPRKRSKSQEDATATKIKRFLRRKEHGYTRLPISRTNFTHLPVEVTTTRLISSLH